MHDQPQLPDSVTVPRHARMVNPDYTFGEELIHSLTHGIGAALAVAALVILVVLAATRGTTVHVVGYSIYGTSLVALFLASTLYHGIQRPAWRPILQRLDHACIYLLIAGTYTPFVLISLRTTLGLTLLSIIWALAVVGILYKIFFINRWTVISTAAYVVMGWLAVVAWREMVANLAPVSLVLVVVGGALYTIGVIFYAMTRIRYTHAIWHFFILAAAACHFAAVLTLL
jgi:hemolysin III